MAQQIWITAARIEYLTSEQNSLAFLRSTLVVLFGIWGFIGLLFNGITFMHLPDGVGVGTSTYLTASMLLWIGGMVLFGVGAAALPVSYEFKRLETPPEQ